MHGLKTYTDFHFFAIGVLRDSEENLHQKQPSEYIENSLHEEKHTQIAITQHITTKTRQLLYLERGHIPETKNPPNKNLHRRRYSDH